MKKVAFGVRVSDPRLVVQEGEMNERRIRFVTPIALAASLMLAACGGGGADTEAQQTVTTKTTGQELLDLKAAYDAGAITEEEYQTQRKMILDRAE
ncbi:MAG: SHOCT domain-containing protein [Alphaproteobacteria bacterium]